MFNFSFFKTNFNISIPKLSLISKVIYYSLIFYNLQLLYNYELLQLTVIFFTTYNHIIIITFIFKVWCLINKYFLHNKAIIIHLIMCLSIAVTFFKKMNVTSSFMGTYFTKSVEKSTYKPIFSAHTARTPLTTFLLVVMTF